MEVCYDNLVPDLECLFESLMGDGHVLATNKQPQNASSAQ